MIFIETPLFTKRIQSMLPDELYAELQHLLALHPNAGNIIRGSGGLRKIRWKAPGKGKRGGLRFIYYWDKPHDVIYMLFVYEKSKQVDLTPDQIKLLRGLVEEWLS